jgi:ABC-type glycerol-3-phosphate transport system permease component
LGIGNVVFFLVVICVTEAEVTVRIHGRTTRRQVTVAAGSLIAAVPVLVVALLVQRRVVDGLTLGAVR